jgi:hypothetical protein
MQQGGGDRCSNVFVYVDQSARYELENVCSSVGEFTNMATG